MSAFWGNDSDQPPYKVIKELHGGYHRFPFVDHAYLYNLYFPPEKMLDEIRTDFKELLMNYPVSQNELARLVSQWTGRLPEQTAVGNGAAELIKILCSEPPGKFIIPVPSFNEYVNAAPRSACIRFPLDPPDFRLDVKSFIRASEKHGVKTAVVVTPNNPTSISLTMSDLEYLMDGFAQLDIRLLMDESFIDFAAPGNTQSVEMNLDRHPHVAVLKSMSKAFGICGLRLGYITSSDTGFIDSVRDRIPIWNINGIAEQFLRLLPQYRDAFETACEKVRRDRDAFFNMLLDIPGISPLKPDANFVLCRLENERLSAQRIAKRMFGKHHILVKDCKGKDMPDGDRYLRIACRTPDENEHLASVLAKLVVFGTGI